MCGETTNPTCGGTQLSPHNFTANMKEPTVAIVDKKGKRRVAAHWPHYQIKIMEPEVLK